MTQPLGRMPRIDAWSIEEEDLPAGKPLLITNDASALAHIDVVPGGPITLAVMDEQRGLHLVQTSYAHEEPADVALDAFALARMRDVVVFARATTPGQRERLAAIAAHAQAHGRCALLVRSEDDSASWPATTWSAIGDVEVDAWQELWVSLLLLAADDDDEAQALALPAAATGAMQWVRVTGDRRATRFVAAWEEQLDDKPVLAAIGAPAFAAWWSPTPQHRRVLPSTWYECRKARKQAYARGHATLWTLVHAPDVAQPRANDRHVVPTVPLPVDERAYDPCVTPADQPWSAAEALVALAVTLQDWGPLHPAIDALVEVHARRHAATADGGQSAHKRARRELADWLLVNAEQQIPDPRLQAQLQAWLADA